MATAVETLEKLERRMTITLPLANVNAEVEKRLKVRARTTKAPGFRPGKVPMKMVAAQFGSQVENEVLNEQVGRAFAEAARENNLRVAGYPNITPKENADEAAEAIEFDATFEVYPDVKFGELSTVEVEKAVAEVTDVEIDKTVDILRKQRSHFHVKGEQGAHGDGGEDQSAQSGDQVTIDFVGSIDGTEFEGGKAEDFVFILGEGRMLPEFEEGTIGLKAGESRTFNVTFPEDYHGEDVAGKTAEFTLTLKKVEWAHLPEVDEDFAKSLGIEDGDITKMREDIRTNLEREVKTRVESKTKDSVMDALIKVTELDVPKTLLEQEEQRLAQMMRQDMAQRGMDIKDMPFPPGVFAEQAERRVRLGLILADIVKENELHVTPEQVKTQVEDFARSYEDPQQVIQYYYSDRNRLAEVEALVLEENVVKYVLDKAKVAEKKFEFDDLMSNNAQA